MVGNNLGVRVPLRVLMNIVDKPSFSIYPAQIHKEENLSPAALYGAIKELRESGFIVEKRNGRQTFLSLTKKGEVVAKNLMIAEGAYSDKNK